MTLLPNESDKYDDIKTKRLSRIVRMVYAASYKRHDDKRIKTYQIDGGIVKYGEAYGDDDEFVGGRLAC